MRPAVSRKRCLPVKKGWQAEQTSTCTCSPLVESTGAGNSGHEHFGMNVFFHDKTSSQSAGPGFEQPALPEWTGTGLTFTDAAQFFYSA